jgi:hypothetical protein
MKKNESYKVALLIAMRLQSENFVKKLQLFKYF